MGKFLTWALLSLSLRLSMYPLHVNIKDLSEKNGLLLLVLIELHSYTNLENNIFLKRSISTGKVE